MAYQNERFVMANLPGKIINHEPASTAFGDTEKERKKPKLHFGQREPNNKKSAITNTFFQAPDIENQSLEDRHIRRLKPDSPNLEINNLKPTIPFGTLAAVFTLAVTIPIGFIQFSETRLNSNIDPITTASISKNNDITIEDVSMTRILRNGTFVVSVHGKIRNLSQTKQHAGEIIISLLNKDGREIQSWRHKTGIASIAKDQSIRFITSAIDITGNAKSVSVKTSPVTVH